MNRMEGKDPRRQRQGSVNRAQGKIFENLVAASCQYYQERRKASIEKTPEPIRQLGNMDHAGRFTACYETKAQPDWKGTLANGQSIVFETKYTSTDALEQRAVTYNQETILETHHSLGAETGVLISFGMRDFYYIPWDVWSHMKEHFGRKFVSYKDPGLEVYRVRYAGSIVLFLDQVERRR